MLYQFITVRLHPSNGTVVGANVVRNVVRNVVKSLANMRVFGFFMIQMWSGFPCQRDPARASS